MDNYQRVYYVSLLDDLHNYFPALLYDTRQFNTVSDVLNYVRESTVRRFNLYDNANQQYHTRVTTPSHIPTNVFMRSPEPHPNIIPSTTRRSEISSLLFPLIRSIGTPRTPAYQDVVVSASQDLISSRSSEEVLVQDLEGNCTICQDRMRQGEQIRKLTTCSHQFHKACIDNWLLNSSVHCPICRHDIRDITLSTTTVPSVSPTLRPSNLRQRTDQSQEGDILGDDLVAYLFGRTTRF